MAEADVSQQNWAGGELSPHMRGRIDLPVYQTGAERLVNFISETAGPARFRNGSQFVNPTRRNQEAFLIPFQFNDIQSYELELTEGYIRFYLDDGVLLLPAQDITLVTNTNPVVVTCIGHGYLEGDEVIIGDVGGEAEVNGRNFVIRNPTTDTFELYDSFGITPIDGTNYGIYVVGVSGGFVQKIYEIQSPYLLKNLDELKYAQNADTLYIVHPDYEPRKLTRSGATNWTLSLFDRIGDPFTDKKVISDITQANPAVVTSTAHGYANGAITIIEDVVGMTEINSKVYLVKNVTTDTFELTDREGANIDSTGYTAYASGGYATNKRLLPGAIAFYQGRLDYGYSDDFPESFWGSKPLDDNGNPQYDDLTIGVNPTDAFKFTLAPISGKVDKIESLVPTLNFLAICTYEGISKVDGGNAGDPISPSTISVSPAITQGVLQQISPILLGLNLVFIHRSGLIMYSLEFDIFYNAYNAVDKNLSNEHITQSGIKQMVYRNGRPPIFFQVRNDGILVGITFLSKENINGGHRHILGGVNAKVLTAGNMPRFNQYDRTWLVVERLINGQTVRYVEFLNDQVVFPELVDYFVEEGNETNETNDLAKWREAMFEAQKQSIHVDSSLSYDGRYTNLLMAIVCT